MYINDTLEEFSIQHHETKSHSRSSAMKQQYLLNNFCSFNANSLSESKLFLTKGHAGFSFITLKLVKEETQSCISVFLSLRSIWNSFWLNYISVVELWKINHTPFWQQTAFKNCYVFTQFIQCVIGPLHSKLGLQLTIIFIINQSADLFLH